MKNSVPRLGDSVAPKIRDTLTKWHVKTWTIRIHRHPLMATSHLSSFVSHDFPILLGIPIISEQMGGIAAYCWVKFAHCHSLLVILVSFWLPN